MQKHAKTFKKLNCENDVHNYLFVGCAKHIFANLFI